MREFSDPVSGKPHPCDGGNCLPELQMQLMVVFTGKTIGKQIGAAIHFRFVELCLRNLPCVDYKRRV